MKQNSAKSDQNWPIYTCIVGTSSQLVHQSSIWRVKYTN